MTPAGLLPQGCDEHRKVAAGGQGDDPAALAKLSAEEQKAFARRWADVAALE